MIETRRSGDLGRAELGQLRCLLELAFHGEFTEQDWAHTLGGWHVFVWHRGALVSHVAVVPRTLCLAQRPMWTGYVEGMATHPHHVRQGFATRAILLANTHIWADYELGALSDGTGISGFYERFGWVPWRGPSAVDGANGTEPTPEEDGGILILPTARSGPLDLDEPITCDPRPGDPW